MLYIEAYKYKKNLIKNTLFIETLFAIYNRGTYICTRKQFPCTPDFPLSHNRPVFQRRTKVHFKGSTMPFCERPGSRFSSLKYNTVMTKATQLVAWTDGGRLRMIPSLVKQLSQQLIERINAIDEQRPKSHFDDPEHFIALSQAYEALAFFYERVGYWRESFSAYVNAADVCLHCDDIWWCDCDEGYLLSKPFRGRFFAMYFACQRLLRKHPKLRNTSSFDTLRHDYEILTRVSRIWEEEFNEALETVRVWHFGR